MKKYSFEIISNKSGLSQVVGCGEKKSNNIDAYIATKYNGHIVNGNLVTKGNTYKINKREIK